MEFDRATIEVLAPAVAAARKALRRLDPEDIPAAVATIARKGDGRLPPPLVRSLLGALDVDADLRGKAAEEAPADGPADLFLRRPDGWEEEVAAIVDDRRARSADNRDRRVEREAADAERRLVTANRKIDELRRRVSDLERQKSESRTAVQEAVRAATESIRAEARAARLDAEESEVQLRASRQRTVDLERRLSVAQTELLQERRSREQTVAEPVATWSGGGARFAEQIDDIHRAARARIDSSGPDRPVVVSLEETSGELRPPLPIGLRPDEAEAVDAIIGWQGTVYIDGYNLSAELGVHPSNPQEGRGRVREVVNRITARGTRAPQVVVVYDTTRGSEERKGEVFVPDADAELRRLAALDPVRTVVVSDDREVIEGVAAAGATYLWSDAVVDWVRRKG